MSDLNVVIAVPMRPDGGHRDRLWAHCRKVWEDRFGWPILEGLHLDGPFNRSAAVNAAVAQAGDDWDVVLVIDSDVICAPDSVRSAVKLAAISDQMVVAHDERIMLNRFGTEKVLAGYDGSWRAKPMVERVWLDSVSCAVAISRNLWELAGPFDELFVGWGREDTAFRIACEAETGPIVKVCGETFHLWHPVSPGVKQASPTRRANEARHQAYLAVRGDREAVRKLREPTSKKPSPTSALEPPAVFNATPLIPKVFHRTVPADTSAEVEENWGKFVDAHPDWEHRTHREPLDPADWPLTGHLFDKCQNGAQKAGLVRLEALVTHGGVYVDSDVDCWQPWDSLLWVPAFAGWEDETTVPDAVLGSVPHHPVFEAMLLAAVLAVGGGADAWTSGPGVTTKYLPGRPDVLLLPPGAFYPWHYLQKGTATDHSPERDPWCFGPHAWAHSWGTPQARRSIERRQRS